MAKFRFKKGYNVGTVIKDLVRTVLMLWVGGTIITEVGDVILLEQSPLFGGLELIGWTVNASGHVTSTSGTGILTVVGIIAIAQIVLKFVDFKM